jgi:putative inorganic carbon (HCO3(-)) transporter
MDGSLFFRGFTAILNFFKRLCGGSFIARAFVADQAGLDNSIQRSYFAALINAVLNKIPKPIVAPMYWPGALSKLCRGSWFINSLCENLDTPIPAAGSRQQVGFGVKAFFQWAFFAAPVIGMAGIVLATPFLPTMMLGALLVPILLLLLLSRRFVVDGATVFIFIFIIISMAVAVVISFTPRQSIQIAVLTALFMLAAPAIGAAAAGRKSVDFFILIFVASAAFTGLVGVYQVLVGYASSDAYLDATLFADIRFRVVSTFANANVYATYLLVLIPIAAACIVFFKHWFLKLCALGATGLLLGNLMLTYTRGAYVALPLAIIVFILLIEKRLLILMVAFVPALPLVLPPTIMGRLLSIVNFSESSTVFRMAIWQGSIRMARDFWATGVGQGLEAYHTVYPYYALSGAGTLHSHNLFLQTLVEVGVVGLLLLIAIVACFFRAQANFFRRATEFRLKVMSAAFMSAMVAFLAQSMFDHSFFNYRILLTFYLFVGLGIAFTRAYQPPQPTPQLPQLDEERAA